MKKNSLATAVIAGVAGVAALAGAAHAVNLNPDGLGQVLIYPYYTVNEGNSTLITVVNTTDEVKAVKVRFVEALNSAEVYDFNLYLSPYDVWATNVIADGDTGAKLFTTDTSCTVPNELPGSFLPWEFQLNNPGRDALGAIGLPRVRQGHLEMIEMGVVTGAMATAATHVNGVPANCGALEAAWLGAWAANPGNGIETPNGGLFGGGVIVSAEYGRTLSYNADAIDGFYTVAGGHLHTDPGSVNPDLGFARTAPGVSTARIFSNGDYYEIDYARGIDAVSAVLTSRYIYNEYNMNADLDAASEWVITFPTKRSYVHFGADDLPFTKAFDADGSCHTYGFKYWDREERTRTTGLIVSPPRPGGVFELCWEANVLAFDQTINADSPSRILGATSTFGGYGLSGFSYQEGWARLEFDHPANDFQYFLPGGVDGGGYDVAFIGQPVTGFWANEAVNNNVAAGIRANYGIIHKHRHSRDCRLDNGAYPLLEGAPACP